MEKRLMKKEKAQGAIEYLLLLAAAIVVVAVVISFMVTTIQPVDETGRQETYRYTCITLDTNSLVCGCFEKNPRKGSIQSNGTHQMANALVCNESLPEPYTNDPLLEWA
jgi:hypothetical protein